MRKILFTMAASFLLLIPIQLWGHQTPPQGQNQDQAQGQLQGQIQIQGQAQSASANNEVDIQTAVDVDNEINASSKNEITASPAMETEVVVTELREFPSQGNVPLPSLPNYYGETPQSHEFQGMRTILRHKSLFTAEEIKLMNTQKRGTDIIVTPTVKKLDRHNRPDVVKVLIDTDHDISNLNILFCGYLTAATKKKNVVSVALLVDAMQWCRVYGANVLVISFEGDNSKLAASGWGIGGAYTHATMSSMQSNGGIGTGGTGYSSGSAGYDGRPWFHALMYRRTK